MSPLMEVIIGSVLAMILIGGVLYFGYAVIVSCVTLVRLFFKGMVDMFTLRSLRQELQKFRR